MNAEKKELSRRDQILQCLARMLETRPGERITTAALAKEVGVSEAALYRHFPSKFKMFEGLIEFVEETIFSRVNQINAESIPILDRLQKILSLILGFSERNPGLSRLLTGEALTGEDPRLRQRVSQLFERLETQLKQLLRQAEMSEGLRTTITVSAAANLLTSFVEGRISQYVRSSFHRKPTDLWQQQWPVLSQGLLHDVSSSGN